ncbi:MAG: M48 family metalloprotease [Bdellovibrionaceae bacterium]|nr:M48 family metalloprotease [Pseudobdellovibrionaceae bacterium]NUM57781.1 M48 family metalloprotease [Pseudobdellovibrionaceae bacterium]
MFSISSSTKVWLFILLSSLSLLILGYSLFERLGLVIGFFISLVINLMIFVYGDFKLHNYFRSRELSGQDAYGVNQILETFCKELNTEKPKIQIYESNSINAFTLGLFWNQPAIYLSEKLVNTLSKDELKCVLLLCLNQIQRMDTFAFGVVSVLANITISLGNILDHVFLFSYYLKKNHWPFSQLFNFICWFFIKSIANYETYFKNDKSSCNVLKDKRIYCELLWKLNGYSETLPEIVPPGTGHLFIVQPIQNKIRWFHLFHPPVPKRIIKLLGHSPL